MTPARWRSLLDAHPEVKKALDQLVRDNPVLTPGRHTLGVSEPVTVPSSEWVPFTSQERVLARQVGWDD